MTPEIHKQAEQRVKKEVGFAIHDDGVMTDDVGMEAEPSYSEALQLWTLAVKQQETLTILTQWFAKYGNDILAQFPDEAVSQTLKEMER